MSTLDTTLKLLREGCRGCDFEEADGELYCHCKKCQAEIVRGFYQLFVCDGIDLPTLTKEAARWRFVAENPLIASKLQYRKANDRAEFLDELISKSLSSTVVSAEPRPVDDSIPTVLRRRYQYLRAEGYNEDFCRSLLVAARRIEELETANAKK